MNMNEMIELNDLALTDDQQEEVKGGAELTTDAQALSEYSLRVRTTRAGTQYQTAADDAASSLQSSMGF